ncbi:MAG TPA: exonuclease domain-containing protein [Chitinophagaceae bacterium]|nr:exonuclease domain-containing protein [Chitinophagaceae bacterium]
MIRFDRMYAIVDIETTGGYAAANGITEISIFIFDGNKIVEKFQTLVNPCQPIPRYITAFTGINDEMVANAPRFETIAEQVYRILHDKIFVAHNVNFDYSFVKEGLHAAGYSFNTKKLCTVRLSRKIFPGFPSYSLGNLCESLQIKINDRHRAAGDAEATVKVFQKLLAHDKEQHIQKSLLRNSKESMLPPNVPKEQFEKLPSLPGIYYFHDAKGKIIYVGKARNIRNRVNSHFSSGFEGRQKQNFVRHTYSISFKTCATELMACILESTEIKKLWPAFNYSQKRWEDVYGIYSFEDQNGYLRLAIEKNKKHLNSAYTFHYLVDGHAVLRKLIHEFNLCPKLCFLQTDNEPCSGIAEEKCFGACEQKEKSNHYNKRVTQAIESLSAQPSYAIIDKGLKDDEQSCILVWNGKFYGMGYLSSDISITEPEQLKDHITPYKENSFIRNLVNGYAARFPSKIISFSNETIQSSH